VHVTKAVVDKLEGEFKVEKTEKIAIMPNVEEETYFIADEEVSGTNCCNYYVADRLFMSNIMVKRASEGQLLKTSYWF
jgi:hypothetical protein